MQRIAALGALLIVLAASRAIGQGVDLSDTERDASYCYGVAIEQATTTLETPCMTT